MGLSHKLRRLPVLGKLCAPTFHGHAYACMVFYMPMRRTALFLKEQQLEKLQKLSEKTGAPVAELVRRAIDLRTMKHSRSTRTCFRGRRN